MSYPTYYRPEIGKREGERLACDLCIYGGNAAGVIAALAAKKRGLRVVLLVNGDHVGGLTTGGLGYTDFGDKRIVGGLAREFYRRLGAHYGTDEEWMFEPSAALKVLTDMLHEAGIKPVLFQYLDSVEMAGKSIRSIRLQSGLVVTSAFFVDATYEGDLMAKAGVACIVGRESNMVYGELLNGVQIREHHQFLFPISPWRREGDPASGLLPGISAEPVAAPGTGDRKVQAYNFRMCLTRKPDRIPFAKPAGYNPDEYELLARYLRAGWRDIFAKFDMIRGRKTDTNNHGAVSTDFIGRNHDYPEAGYEARERIFQEHVTYQQGLLWFYANDERVPADVRHQMSQWGLVADEFSASGHWPPQLYVREARRMVSDYVITEFDCRTYRRASDVIGCGAYGMDSHNCQRIVLDGRVLNEGDVQVWINKPYPISYRTVIPARESVNNLFVPLCLSASHIAYGSVRMEPVFMVLAESCAIAAALCVRHACTTHELPYAVLKPELELARQALAPEQVPASADDPGKELLPVVCERDEPAIA